MRTLFILLITFMTFCSVGNTEENIIYVDLVDISGDPIKYELINQYEYVNITEESVKSPRIVRITVRSMFNFNIYPNGKRIHNRAHFNILDYSRIHVLIYRTHGSHNLYQNSMFYLNRD